MAWKAREVAHRTSELSVVSARVVDRIVTGQVELLAWGRFEKLLDATLLQVDEKTYQQRAARAAAQRDVRATQSGDGLADPGGPGRRRGCAKPIQYKPNR